MLIVFFIDILTLLINLNELEFFLVSPCNLRSGLNKKFLKIIYVKKHIFFPFIDMEIDLIISNNIINNPLFDPHVCAIINSFNHRPVYSSCGYQKIKDIIFFGLFYEYKSLRAMFSGNDNYLLMTTGSLVDEFKFNRIQIFEWCGESQNRVCFDFLIKKLQTVLSHTVLQTLEAAYFMGLITGGSDLKMIQKIYQDRHQPQIRNINSYNLMNLCAQHGHVELYDYFSSLNVEKGFKTFEAALKSGNLELIKKTEKSDLTDHFFTSVDEIGAHLSTIQYCESVIVNPNVLKNQYLKFFKSALRDQNAESIKYLLSKTPWLDLVVGSSMISNQYVFHKEFDIDFVIFLLQSYPEHKIDILGICLFQRPDAVVAVEYFFSASGRLQYGITDEVLMQIFSSHFSYICDDMLEYFLNDYKFSLVNPLIIKLLINGLVHDAVNYIQKYSLKILNIIFEYGLKNQIDLVASYVDHFKKLLSLAVINNNEPVVSFLLKNGVKPDTDYLHHNIYKNGIKPHIFHLLYSYLSPQEIKCLMMKLKVNNFLFNVNYSNPSLS